MRIALLSLVAFAVAAAAKSCHQYDIVGLVCMRDGVAPEPAKNFQHEIDTVVREVKGLQVFKGRPSKAAIPKEPVRNPCLGGDGMAVVDEWQKVALDTGPSQLKCIEGFSKYQSKIKIWRWRNKLAFCAKINERIKDELEYRGSPYTYWYSHTKGGQVACTA